MVASVVKVCECVSLHLYSLITAGLSWLCLGIRPQVNLSLTIVFSQAVLHGSRCRASHAVRRLAIKCWVFRHIDHTETNGKYSGIAVVSLD